MASHGSEDLDRADGAGLLAAERRVDRLDPSREVLPTARVALATRRARLGAGPQRQREEPARVGARRSVTAGGETAAHARVGARGRGYGVRPREAAFLGIPGVQGQQEVLHDVVGHLEAELLAGLAVEAE